MNWTEVLVALIAAGLLAYIRDGVRWLAARRREGTPEARDSLAVETVDASLAVVAKARDELAEDNARLREQLAESDRRYTAELAHWQAEKNLMRAEINDLEQRLRALLTEVQSLRLRHE